jgi:alpha-L-rhamnosidase
MPHYFRLRFHGSWIRGFVFCLVIVCFSPMEIFAAPPLQAFSTISSDGTGRKLQASMIWTNPPLDSRGVAVAFRKTFSLQQLPTQATFSIFADARYVLWVNGNYVDRGPSRFQPNGPQYDVVNLASRLQVGRNAIVLLVVGKLSGGKVMLHAPGLTALMEIDGDELLRTDPSWKWSDRTRFRKVTASWANLADNLVDARIENGDWTQVEYDDETWKSAAKISSDGWGPLTRTLIPPLRESPVAVTFKNSAKLPVILRAGEKLEFDAGRIVQAYPVIELDADANSELAIEPFGVKYLARAGRQSYFAIDTRGLSQGAVIVKSGRATITGFKLIERVYAYTRVGSFTSNDQYLNELWQMCARSCEVLSEDSYVDCADRERVEWMDDSPPGFDITQTAMAGPGTDGKLVYSDPRLLAAMIRRTALTLQPEGWVKAHTCSDRYDIHAKMEDRACDWIEGERIYDEATGDASIVRETWPAIQAQMDYFLNRRTSRGLVRGRDWVVWGNPVGYMVGEGTTLNVFVQKALVDAAYLGAQIGEKADTARFAHAADDLGKAINSVLWDEGVGAYYSGYFTDADITENLAAKRKLSLALTDHLALSTLHSNVFALDRGIVPPTRRARVIAKMLEQERDYNDKPIMVYYYAMKQLYALDRPELDERVLALFRDKWADMVTSPWQCSWEAFDGGSKAHIYGMYPGYFLSSYVLGVRRDGPISDKHLLIEPHLGDLAQAQGIVVTEFGPVSISWTRDGASLNFNCAIPPGVKASLRLPHNPSANSLMLDGKSIKARKAGIRWVTNIGAGEHTGTVLLPI